MAKTNHIGFGASMLTLSLPRDASALLGRMAFAWKRRSKSHLTRELILAGLEAKARELASGSVEADLADAGLDVGAAAKRFREICVRYYGLTFLVLFVGILALGNGDDLRGRRVRSARGRRSECGEHWEVEV